MKRITLFLIAIFSLVYSGDLKAQHKRVSPKDSVEAMLKKDTYVKIVYSRPSLKGRDVHQVVPYGELWRTGANEATTFEVSKDVAIEGKRLRAGKYSLYTIPGEKETTVIFNNVWNQWGTRYDEEQDVIRFTTPTKVKSKGPDTFTINLQTNGLVSLEWSEMLIQFRVKP